MPDGCLIADQLTQGLLGLLPHDEQAGFERHILQCGACQELAAGLHVRDSLVSAIHNNARHSSLATGDEETVTRFRSWLSTSGSEPEATVAPTAEFTGNDRFRIDRRLGAGGMGIVYQAFDRERDEVIALKTLRRLGPKAAMRLTHEFRALADLRHPNLVPLYELYAEGDRRFFTMELIDGDDFLTFVRDRRSPSGGALNLTRLRTALPQLVAGLRALHDAGKLHRDVKPSNVLIDNKGRLALVDFGLALEADAEAADIAGTAAYMSPEQAAGRRLTPASDWYSVGVMLFQAMTGDLPFAGQPREVMARKQIEEPLPLDYWGRDLPDQLKILCADLVRTQPDQRPVGAAVAARLASGAIATSIGQKASAVQDSRPSAPAAACFVGRETELQALHSALDTVARGTATSVMVSGPSGVGKTALCLEFLRQAPARHAAIVLTGRCYERELVPYKVAEGFLESLVVYLRQQRETDVRSWVTDELRQAMRGLPILRRLAAVVAPGTEGACEDACAMATPAVAVGPSTDDPAERKRNAFAALRELLRRITARCPMVVFLDDVQWGDADSPGLFAECLRGPNAPRILRIAAYRGQGSAATPWMAAWREREKRSGFAWASREIAVGPLSPGAARELALRLARDIGQAGDGEIEADGLVRQAQGHPLLLREIVGHATAVGRADNCPLTDLGDIMWRRIAALDAASYRLLEVVLVAGYPLALRRAHHAAAIRLADRHPLEALLAANLARTTGDDCLGGLVAFHDAVRETFLARSSAEAIADTHRRLAEVAAAEDPVDGEALVIHYQGAGQQERAALHAAAAADRAAAGLAFDLAIRCYRLALELGDWQGDRSRDLREKLAAALSNAGRSREAAEEYLCLARCSTADSLRFTRLAGEQLMWAGLPDEALSTFAPVFRDFKMRPPPAARGSLLVSLICHQAWLTLTGYRLRSTRQDPRDPRLFEQIDCCSRMGGALSCYDYLRGAVLMARTSRLALKSGDDSRIAFVLGQQAVVSAFTGRLRRAAAFQARGEVLARRCRDDYALGCVTYARGAAQMIVGEWRQSLALFDSVKEYSYGQPEQRFAHLQTEWLSQYSLFYSGKLRQLAERVSDYLHDALERHDHFGATIFRLNMANLVWLVLDRPDEARRQVDDALQGWPTDLYPLPHYFALASRLRADLYVGDAPAAWGRVADQWPRLTKSGLLRLSLISIEAHHVRACCALAAMRHGNADRAIPRLLRRSIRFLQRHAFAWTRALASLAQAGLLEVSGDLPGAVRGYGAAHQRLINAQMPLYAAAASRRLAELTGDERLVTEADDLLTAHGVSNPFRMARLLAGQTDS